MHASAVTTAARQGAPQRTASAYRQCLRSANRVADAEQRGAMRGYLQRAFRDRADVADGALLAAKLGFAAEQAKFRNMSWRKFCRVVNEAAEMVAPPRAAGRRVQAVAAAGGTVPSESAFEQSVGDTALIPLLGPSLATGCRILGKAEYQNPGGSVKV
jgi:hypothetical protein